MRKNKFLLIAILISVLTTVILIVFSTSLNFETGGLKTKAVTDKEEYQIGGDLKVKIENDSAKSICFSSCYPYYFEKKRIGWKAYPYIECPYSDLAAVCVDPKQVKAFELDIPGLEKGDHRLAIPACVGCSLNEAFRKDQWFYSNGFIIK